MSSTPSNSTPRPFIANTGLGLKLTPSNSPFPRTPRSPHKSRAAYDSGLSLRRIIGTTVSSPTGFDSNSSLRIFGYCAGAAVVITTIDEDREYTQKFFRARPTAVPLLTNNLATSISSAAFAPATPTNTANDARNRSVVSLRESAIGNSPSTPGTSQFDWSDSPSSKTWTSRERIKAATCLSISKDGRFLAVGETGYMPRVLIFSLQDSSDCPLVVLNEHTFGVRAIAFSPDQRYLASLGSSNDGFLYIWAIAKNGMAKLHSSNKCTSFIRGMAWLGSNSLITVGTRHVKVWRIEDGGSSSPSKQKFNLDGSPFPVTLPSLSVKTLAGRNCVLGTLVESTFSCVVAISETTAVVCSEKGDICLLHDREGQKLVKVGQTGFNVACIAVDVDRELVSLGGRVGLSTTIRFQDLFANSSNGLLIDQNQPDLISDSPQETLCAMAFVDGHKVTIDSRHTIFISAADSPSNGPESRRLTSHSDSILGVRLLQQPNDMQADFYTWSSTGEIHFWDLQGRSKCSLQVEIEQMSRDEDSANQCQVVRASSSTTFLVVGDKYGMLKIVDIKTGLSTFNTKAHGSEILDIAIFESPTLTLIASASRDRTVQLFRMQRDWTLSQTMDEHTASVNGVLFCEQGEKLISISSDRTCIIRQISMRELPDQSIIAAVPDRVITLKASPVSMLSSYHGTPTTLIISCLDRTVNTYELSSGGLINSFRATDGEGNDAVVMDSLIIGDVATNGGHPVLAGVSSTDKSVRLYDGISGAFIDREWGHTASITGVTLLQTSDPEQTTVISTGAGTIMIWDLASRVSVEREDIADQADGLRNYSPPKDSPFARPPLRRILSRAELAEFQRPSVNTTPTGRTSPPRPLRKKASKYSLAAQSTKITLPTIPSIPANYAANSVETNSRRGSPKTRSRSPPPTSPKSKSLSRRSSMASLDIRGRTRSTGNFSEFGSLNMATEQTVRTLRAYRKKLGSSEAVREDVLKELDQELRMTAKALGEKTLKTKALNETVLTGLLDQYSDRLISIFDEKLRLSLSPNMIPENGGSAVNGTAGRGVIGLSE